MSKKPSPKKQSLVSAKPRFPRSALEYLDTVLAGQRMLFRANTVFPAEQKSLAVPPAPKEVCLSAESDEFRGTGWSPLINATQPYRWMGRVGTLLLRADLTENAQLTISGSAMKRYKFAKGLTVWIDGYPVSGTVRRLGWNTWQFTGTIPAIPASGQPFHLLRLDAPGQKRLKTLPDTAWASLGVSRITISP